MATQERIVAGNTQPSSEEGSTTTSTKDMIQLRTGNAYQSIIADQVNNANGMHFASSAQQTSEANVAHSVFGNNVNISGGVNVGK